LRPPPSATPFPYTTLFRSHVGSAYVAHPVLVQSLGGGARARAHTLSGAGTGFRLGVADTVQSGAHHFCLARISGACLGSSDNPKDRKSTRLNSSHVKSS